MKQDADTAKEIYMDTIKKGVENQWKNRAVKSKENYERLLYEPEEVTNDLKRRFDLQQKINFTEREKQIYQDSKIHFRSSFFMRLVS